MIKQFYKWRHPEIPEEKIPARYNVSLWLGVKELYTQEGVLDISFMPEECFDSPKGDVFHPALVDMGSHAASEASQMKLGVICFDEC